MSNVSLAYQAFRESLKQPEALRRLEATLSDPPDPDDVALAEGLRGGVIVLLVAAFEGYLRDVFEERVDDLGTHIDATMFERLPDQVRVAAVFNLLEESMKGAPGKKVPEERKDRIAGIRVAAAAVSASNLRGSAFSTTYSNPSSDTVRTMFKQVGRVDIFAGVQTRFVRYWGKPVASAFIKSQLDHYVSSRHEVAHGANVLAWSRKDLREAERFFRHLGHAVDDELRVHLNKVRRSAA